MSALLLTLVVAAVALVHRAPINPPPSSPWRAIERIGLLFGLVPDLPAEWAVDLDKIVQPQEVAHDAVTAPLGAIANPFKDTNARQAWQAWHEGRFQDAVEPASKAWHALAKADPDKERPLVAFLYAQTRIYAKDQPGALAAAKVATQHPVLGGDALTFLAERADEQGLSMVVLALLRNRNEPQHQLLKAKALRRNGQLESATEALAAVKAASGTALWRKQQLEALRLAHVRGKAEEAVALAQLLIHQAGKSAQTEEAIDFLLGGSDGVWQSRLKKRPQDAPAVLDALVWTAQRRRYARATPALESLAKDESVPVAVRCHARSWAAHTHDRKGELDASIALLESVAQDCTAPEVRALAVDEDTLAPGDAEWRIGRARLLQGKLDGVADLKKALALGLGGLDGEDAKTLQHLATLPDAATKLKQHGATSANDYAERDIVDVMAWRFAMDAMVAGKWPDALKILDRLVEVRDSEATATAFAPRAVDAPPPRYDDRDWARGRADYFAGRALQALGKDSAAIERWKRVVLRHPLSYYATMSLAQLQTSGAQMPDLPKEPLNAGPQLTQKLLSDVNVQRARLLGQLGWHDEAGDLLDAVGLGRDVAANDKWSAGDPGGAWVRAALDDEAERWTSSHAMGRDALRRYATRYPAEGNKQAWQIAYPRAFQTLIEGAAREFNLHPSVVWAIGRSESGFNPRVESHAAAIGLLQLILPTAQAMAKPLGLTADATTLRQPSVNVRLGARYLKSLLGRFDREAQMAAGYNAGGGAVGRWRKTRGDWPMDLFVESIPFRETRDYAKRVCSSIAVYRNLYDGETLHAFGLTQKALPTQDEPPTEPSATASTQVATKPAVAVVEHNAETLEVVAAPQKPAVTVVAHAPQHVSKTHSPAQPLTVEKATPAAKAHAASKRGRHANVAQHHAAKSERVARGAHKHTPAAASHHAVRKPARERILVSAVVHPAKPTKAVAPAKAKHHRRR